MANDCDVNECAIDSLFRYGGIRKLMLPAAKALAAASAELSRYDDETDGRTSEILEEMCVACESRLYRFVVEDLNEVGFAVVRKEGGAS